MTTAAKYGAQDLNGNLFNYQQLVSPIAGGASNLVVNTTFANRSASDSKVRLALSSTALASQTVSSIQGVYPFAASASAAATTVETQQTLSIGTTTTSTNVFTTTSFLVTATTAGTNLITVSSTTSFVVGEPVVFSANIGGLTAGTIYYVLTIPSTTTFSVSTVWNGAIVSLTSAIANVIVQESTTNLAVGQQIQFHGSVFGGVYYNTTYYILTIPSSTTFTISATPNGSAFALASATGTMYGNTLTATNFNSTLTNPAAINVASTVNSTYANTLQGLTISNTTASTNVLTTASVGVTNTTASTTSANGYITTAANGTNTLTAGQPVVFSGSIGGLISGTVYYVLNIYSATTFSVSATLNGPPFTLSTASGSVNVQQSTTNLQLNQPIMFAGTGFGYLVPNIPYYVSTIPGTTTFTVSTTPGGSAVSLLTATGTMVTTSTNVPAPLTISNTTTSTNILTTATVAVTATTATTNLITCTSTATLAIGMPVVFSGNISNIVSGTIYYVLTIASSTTFSVSTNVNGSSYPLTTTSGSVNVQQATTALQINQPIIFTSPASFGGVSTGVIYYVQSIVSSTTFQISAIHGGAALALTTASGTMTGMILYFVPTVNVGISTATTNIYTTSAISVTATSGTAPYIITCTSTATLAVGQPVVFSVTTNNIIAGTVYYVATLDSSTTFQISATYLGTAFTLTSGTTANTVSQATTNLSVGQPVVFNGSAFGGVTATTVTYYVYSIPSTTTFSLSTAINGTQFALSTTTGTMITTIGPRPMLTISSTSSSNQFAMQVYGVTATTLTTNLITANNTYQLAVGMPIVFSGALGGLVSGTIYYVLTIPSATTFTVSATPGGPVFVLTTASGSINFQQATSNLSINQALQFALTISGTTYTGVTPGTTYYVRTIDSNILFTASAVPSQAAATATILTVSGGVVINCLPITNNIIGAYAYQTAAIAVTATTNNSSTYPITCATTAGLAVGMPVVFDASNGGLVLGTTYYVNAILGATSFNVSATQYGPVLALSTTAPTMNVYPSTASLYTGQPVQFTGTPFGIPAALLATSTNGGQIYYVQSTPSYNTVILSLISTSANVNTAANSGTGLLPLGLTAAASGTMTLNTVVPVPPLTVSTSTGTAPYTYATANIAVTATTATVNTVTCATTATLAVGMPVVFSSGLGNIVSATVYYITGIPSSTTFVMSATFNGTAFVQTTTTGSINVQQATTFLQLNQPIIFNGTVFGGVSAGVTYYVLTIPSTTTFTITTIPNYTAQTLSATTGTMVAIIGPYKGMNILSTSTTTFVPATFTAIATTARSGTHLVTVNNTYALYQGCPVAFSSTLGILVANQVYYVTSIYDERQFTISLNPPNALGFSSVAGAWQTANGNALVLTTATGSVTMYQSTAKLQLNQAVIFYTNIGTVFGTGVTAGTVYYITTQTGASASGTFSVSLTPGGSAISPGTAGGSNAAMLMIPLLTAPTATNVYQSQPLPIVAATTSSNILTVGNLALVTGTAITTNLITCTSTSALSIGMPVVFSAAVGSLAANTTYYVLTINSTTTFTVSQTWGGQVAILTNSYGGVYVQPSTANLSVAQPIVFTGSVFGGFIAYTTYYVATIPSATTFTLATSTSNAIAGTVISIATTTTGYMTAYGSTAGLLSNMNASIAPNAPITFVGATITVTAINGTTLYTPGNTGYLAVNQAVVFTGYTFISGITAGTVYYIQSTPTVNTFTLSLAPSGAAITWNTGSNTLTMQVVNSTGTALTPYTGYYVQSVPSPTTFTISASAGGAVTALTATTGTVVVSSNIATLATGSSTSYFLPGQPVVFVNTSGSVFGGVNTMATSTGLSYICTGTTSGSPGYVTCASTANLVVGQPITFSGIIAGGVVAFTTYYVQSVLSGTTFSLSLTLGGAAITLTTVSSQTFYGIPSYYVKAVLNSTQVVLSATANGAPVAIGTGYASGTNIMTLVPLPMYTDFIEYDALIATNGILERTGVLVPPNTYLYASSNISQTNVTAIGIQELV